MIVLMPEAGLCNRMRAIGAALALSRETGCSLEVIWCQDRSLNCRLDELFVVPERITRLTQVDASTFSGRLMHRCLHGYYAHLFDIYLSQKTIENDGNLRDRIKMMVISKRVYIRTYSLFYQANQLFKEFVLIEPLRSIVQSYAQDLNHMVGVHIRRTDNNRSVMQSSTARFIEMMKKEIQRDGNAVFFVATDAPSEEKLLIAEFPGRIVVHPKRSLSRNDPRAIQDALIDLYCLSKCKKLIGSYWSSFTDTAWQINGIDHVIAHDDDHVS